MIPTIVDLPGDHSNRIRKETMAHLPTILRGIAIEGSRRGAPDRWPSGRRCPRPHSPRTSAPRRPEGGCHLPPALSYYLSWEANFPIARAGVCGRRMMISTGNVRGGKCGHLQTKKASNKSKSNIHSKNKQTKKIMKCIFYLKKVEY